MMIFSFFSFFVTSIMVIVDGRQADERSKFLYLWNPQADGVILEYEPHMHMISHYIMEDEDEIEKNKEDYHKLLANFVEGQREPNEEEKAERLQKIMSSDEAGSIENTVNVIINNDKKAEKDWKEMIEQREERIRLWEEKMAALLLATEDEEEDTDKKHHRRPFFLQQQYPIPRVVQYYSPWCGMCQSLVSKYIAIAKHFLDRLPPYSLEFYAVSCSEHHNLCHNWELENQIRHYPTIRLYLPKGSKDNSDNEEQEEFIELGQISIEAVEEALPPELFPKNYITKRQHDLMESSVTRDTDGARMERKPSNTVDILGATQDGYRHTRTDVYRDAALSLTYALENHIYFNGKETPLTSEEASALYEWLDLLHWTLPPTWMVHTLISHLRRNRNIIVKSKSALQQIVKANLDVIYDDEAFDMQWSEGCGGGGNGDANDILASFSCGLWCLFHIIGCGVYERHNAVLGHHDRVSTYHAAETLMNYMTNFFGWCPQCKAQALELYNNCAFNSCTRFLHRSGNYHLLSSSASSNRNMNDSNQTPERRRRKIKPPSDEHWREFPLWLYEFHNEINERLLTKEARKLYNRQPTINELHYAQWPPIEACPLCYSDDVNSDEKKKKRRRKPNPRYIYDYIREEYWPTGIQNFRFVVLDKKNDPHPHFHEYKEEKYLKNNRQRHRQLLFYFDRVLWQPFWEECQYLWYYHTITWRKHPWFRAAVAALSRSSNKDQEGKNTPFLFYMKNTLILMSTWYLYKTFVKAQQQMKDRHIRKTGRHKKFDTPIFSDNDDTL